MTEITSMALYIMISDGQNDISVNCMVIFKGDLHILQFVTVCLLVFYVCLKHYVKMLESRKVFGSAVGMWVKWSATLIWRVLKLITEWIKNYLFSNLKAKDSYTRLFIFLQGFIMDIHKPFCPIHSTCLKPRK